MGKSSGSTTTTSGPDAGTLARAQELWKAAQAAANGGAPGVNALSGQAIGGYQQAAGAGGLGLSALSGNADAYKTLSNPYQQNVLDAMGKNYGNLANQTINSVNDRATQAGAFGGSRGAIAQGQALGDLNRDQASQMANLTYQGFTDTMNRAGGLANLGMGANNALMGAGDYSRQVQMQQNPDLWRLGILGGAMGQMPNGMTQTTTQSGGHNPISGAAGGALAGWQAGGPWGGLIGGIGGLFG